MKNVKKKIYFSVKQVDWDIDGNFSKERWEITDLQSDTKVVIDGLRYRDIIDEYGSLEDEMDMESYLLLWDELDFPEKKEV